MTAYKEKDRVFHATHGPCTVWAVNEKTNAVGVKTDDGNLIVVSRKNLIHRNPKDHWVSNATNLLINGGMEAVYDALATGALPVPERQYRASDVFVGRLEADSHPGWTVDRIYVAHQPYYGSHLEITDDKGRRHRLTTLLEQGVLAFHHRP